MRSFVSSHEVVTSSSASTGRTGRGTNTTRAITHALSIDLRASAEAPGGGLPGPSAVALGGGAPGPALALPFAYEGLEVFYVGCAIGRWGLVD